MGVEPFFVPSWPLREVATVGVASAAAAATTTATVTTSAVFLFDAAAC